ncbi:hypothetical protein CALVIDRAFT_524116 [Calocera viscosa TUFC12733]|uniref:Uncharacterized protein n=1 Tax=Calocera viscosa (strain TUFC12733) TaxID=1330018 RepID=A0A167SD78_CALVF|nr:hypothetical protein CALVIDRAFT_524116 [Calocera viscosa TUFC12733]
MCIGLTNYSRRVTAVEIIIPSNYTFAPRAMLAVSDRNVAEVEGVGLCDEEWMHGHASPERALDEVTRGEQESVDLVSGQHNNITPVSRLWGGAAADTSTVTSAASARSADAANLVSHQHNNITPVSRLWGGAAADTSTVTSAASARSADAANLVSRQHNNITPVSRLWGGTAADTSTVTPAASAHSADATNLISGQHNNITHVSALRLRESTAASLRGRSATDTAISPEPSIYSSVDSQPITPPPNSAILTHTPDIDLFPEDIAPGDPVPPPYPDMLPPLYSPPRPKKKKIRVKYVYDKEALTQDAKKAAAQQHAVEKQAIQIRQVAHHPRSITLMMYTDLGDYKPPVPWYASGYGSNTDPEITGLCWGPTGRWCYVGTEGSIMEWSVAREQRTWWDDVEFA